MQTKGSYDMFLYFITYKFSNSAVIEATSLWDERPNFNSWQGVRSPEFFLFFTTSRPALEPIQPPIQQVQGALSLGGKVAGA